MTASTEPPVSSLPVREGPTFESVNPRTGDVVGEHPIHSPEEVAEAVERARLAGIWWREIGFDGRKEYLLQWRSVITRRLAQLTHLVHLETGKPHSDAQLEIGLAIDHIHWAAKHAKKVLGPRKVNSGVFAVNHESSVRYNPLGVVGVIGPWNYPVFTPLGSTTYALAAGNTVVFKPSEYTPGVGQWLVDTFTEIVGGRPILQLVTGFGETGAALCAAGVDKVAFTGSAATGKRVMAACAETLTPVVIEAGGKDSVIVDRDADLAAAADGALWSAMSNAGQTCIGAERVYVHRAVFEPFMDELLTRARTLRADADPDSPLGPITMPKQLPIIQSHIDDAIAKGGRVVLGGAGAVGERFVQPTIITHVPEDSLAITEETFGPTLVVNPVDDMDEAVQLTNATAYGLAGSVFGKRQATSIAERVRSGMTSINAVAMFAGVPALPFGGVGDSGFGRIHGADGLREFTYAKSITRQRFKPLLNLTTFERDEKTDKTAALLIGLLYGGKKTLR
ncbi:MAG: aldehyde dehydrogenase family protein [Aeromicrobium sp.]|uniref:aldehyde dehydrogenase family protein n=1 Tax=Aeromicrobium sp. TaxID=1871063 RepID=UPI0039E6BAB0